MKITKVNIRPVDMNKVKAIASITIDDDFVVHDLRVVEGEKGTFVAMPSRKLPSGEYRDIAHPINTETREAVQSAVLAEFENMKSSAPQLEEAEVESEEKAGEEMAEEPKEEVAEETVEEKEEPSSEESPAETSSEEPQDKASGEEEPPKL